LVGLLVNLGMLIKFMIKIILFFISLLYFTGCSKKSIEIYDLSHIPQNIEFYTQNLEKNTNANNYDLYKKSYFSVWNIDKPNTTLKDIKWTFRAFNPTNSYGENLQPLKQSFFDDMLKNSNFKKYLTLNKKAITLRYSNLRAFPTDRPLLRDPKKAGEGYPFDYLQNSSILANKPLFVSHYSNDKNWVYVFTSFASGWLKTSDIVFLESITTKIWQDSQHIYITKEGVPLYTSAGDGLYNSKIGMSFLLLEEDKNNFTVLAIKENGNSKPLYVESIIPKKIAYKGVLNFNKKNINNIIKEISKTNYGWGGLYGQRDCSSTMRDYFTPFGIWLPRNSYLQSRKGKVIDLSSLEDKEKLNIIKKRAIPFKTLLYKRGHILLYVGTFKDEVIAFHNMWGIKTNKDGIYGRIIVGRPVFSTLEIGKKQENFVKDSTLLKNIRSMNILAN